MRQDPPLTIKNEEIYNLELLLLTPSVRQSTDQLRLLIADDFVEYGSSGRIYNKLDLLESLPEEKQECYAVEDFTSSELSKNVILATYKVTIGTRQSLRSSIWRHNGSNWQMIFHQGTNCQT